jgi:hypothetical protein
VSAETLRGALSALAIDCEIEAHGAVAVLITAHPEQLRAPERRQAALEAAAANGFRTLAVEMREGAPLPASRDTTSGRADLHRA